MSSQQTFTYNAAAFGRMILAWRRQASWAHSTAQVWGEQAGFPSVTNGTWSRLENGRIAQPELGTFLQLEILNERAWSQNYRGIRDSGLFERVKQLIPIVKDDGRPWAYNDFIDVFIGRREPPEHLTGLLLPEDAAALSAEAQQLFERTAKARTMSSTMAWQELSMHLRDKLPDPDLEKLRLVVTGWEQWTPTELEGLRNVETNVTPINLLRQWAQG